MAITGGSLTDAEGKAISSQANGSQQALDVGVNVGGVQVDPREVRPLSPGVDSVSVQDITGSVVLPTGASTEAKQDVGNSSLSSIDGKLNSLGQKSSANSMPVVLASDQPSIPVVSSTPSGALVDSSGSTSATPSTSTVLMAANASRKYLIIQNHGNKDIWINFTAAATKSQPSLKILPGAAFTMEGSFISTEAINVISSGVSQPFSAKEA